jgi:phosphomannomutase
MSETLIVSVSGVRGLVGKDLTPELVAGYAAALGVLLRGSGDEIVLARDARTSGSMFAVAAAAGLQSVGMNVVDCGLIPTPTAQLAVEHHRAAGGIVITASHNPVEWNALKFVGPDGMFLPQEMAGRLFDLAQSGGFARAGWDTVGGMTTDGNAVQRHIEGVLGLSVLNVAKIRQRAIVVALDCVRGAGGTIMPELLERLGCQAVTMDVEPDGRFPRSPEPVPANLVKLGELVRRSGAVIGMAVDPDVDRLALVDESGSPIGEDYTLAFAVRSVLQQRAGPVVTNLSTSLVVDDAAREFGIQVARAPVGEANVAAAMKSGRAVIGGEGNGGVMFPALHIGRDAPLAAALVLDLMARTGLTVSELVAAQPKYVIVKAKGPRNRDLEPVYGDLEDAFPDATVDRQDGLRLAWPDRWLHVRPSGTEPIVRFIAEARTEAAAQQLIDAVRVRLATPGQSG